MNCLIVKSGSRAGTKILLTGNRQSIGRSAESVIRFEDRSVSRNHAVVYRTPEDKWFIEDCGSSHGTVVNGENLQSAELTSGASIKLGQVSLEFLTDARPAMRVVPPPPPEPSLSEQVRQQSAGRAESAPDESLREAFAKFYAGKAEEKRKREHAALEIMSSYEEKKKESKGRSLVRSSSKTVWFVLCGVILVMGGILYFGFRKPMDVSKINISEETVNSVVDYMQKKGMKGGKGKKSVGVQGVGGEHSMDAKSGSGSGSSGSSNSPAAGAGSGSPLQNQNAPKDGKLNINEAAAGGSSSSGGESKPANQSPAGGSSSGKDPDGNTQGKQELHVKSDSSQGAGEGDMDKKIADAERDAGTRTEKEEDDYAAGKKRNPKGLLTVTSDDAGSAKTIKMVEEDYIYDDGAPESRLSAPAQGGIIAIEITPSVYPAYLNEVLFFVDFDPWLSSFQIVVVENPDGEGPMTSRIVYESIPMSAFEGRGWFRYDLVGGGFRKPLKSGKWIVGIRTLAADGPYVGRDDSTSLPPGFTYSPEGDNWSEMGRAGVPMIRAVGSYADWK